MALSTLKLVLSNSLGGTTYLVLCGGTIHWVDSSLIQLEFGASRQDGFNPTISGASLLSRSWIDLLPCSSCSNGPLLIDYGHHHHVRELILGFAQDCAGSTR